MYRPPADPRPDPARAPRVPASPTSPALLSSDAIELEPSDARHTAIALLRGADLPAEAIADRLTILEHVDHHPDIADRTCRPGHLTGSALVVDSTATRTLLMLHAKLGRWFQPGGHADGDTNLAAVALREATEETGIAGLRVRVPAIDVDIHEVRPPNEDAHLHLDVRFLVIAPAGAEESGNEESLALRWVTEHEIDELVPVVDHRTRRLVSVGLRTARQLLGR